MRRLTLAVAMTLLAPAVAQAGEKANFAGRWTLNDALSGDLEGQITAAAGPAQLQNPGTIGNLPRLFPQAATRRDTERFELRSFLMERLADLKDVEIEQSGDEIKTIHAGDGVRIFHFARTSAGTSRLGSTVQRSTRWKDDQLILESSGDELKLTEVLTLVPPRAQLIYLMRLEAPALSQPLDLQLVYDLVREPPAAR